MDAGRLWRWMRAGLLVHLTFITPPLLHSHLKITNSALIMSFSPCTWLFRMSLLLNVFDKGSSQLFLILRTFWKKVLDLSTGTIKHLNEASVEHSQFQSCRTVTETGQLRNTKGTGPSSYLNKYNQLPQSDLSIQLT